MKKVLTLMFMALLVAVLPVMAQDGPDKSEQMIHAQLRFITEKAHLTKKEYRSFAPIYIEYNKALLELNKDQQPGMKPGGMGMPQGMPQGMPGGIGMPFDFHPDQKQQEYGKKWAEINDNYRVKLEKALPDSTRQKIGMAQWELSQKIWQEWAEKGREAMERQFGHMGAPGPNVGGGPDSLWLKNMERDHPEAVQQWREMDARREQWVNNYWRQWHFPGQTMPGQRPQPWQMPGYGPKPSGNEKK